MTSPVLMQTLSAAHSSLSLAMSYLKSEMSHRWDVYLSGVRTGVRGDFLPALYFIHESFPADSGLLTHHLHSFLPTRSHGFGFVQLQTITVGERGLWNH